MDKDSIDVLQKYLNFKRFLYRSSYDKNEYMNIVKKDIKDFTHNKILYSKKFWTTISIVIIPFICLKHNKLSSFPYLYKQIKEINKIPKRLIKSNFSFKALPNLSYNKFQILFKNDFNKKKINENITNNNENDKCEDIENENNRYTKTHESSDVIVKPNSGISNKTNIDNNNFYVLHIPTLLPKGKIDGSCVFKVKLAGIDYLSPQGVTVVNNIFNQNFNKGILKLRSNFKIILQEKTTSKSDDKNDNDTNQSQTELYVWCLYRKGFFYQWENLNIFLIKQGYAELKPFKDQYNLKKFGNTEIHDYINNIESSYKHAKRMNYGIFKKLTSEGQESSNDYYKQYFHETGFRKMKRFWKKRTNLNSFDKTFYKSYNKI